MHYLGLADLMVIMEEAGGTTAAELLHQVDLHRADCALSAPRAGYGDVELYPELATKAARLCWEIIRYDPLPGASTRTGYLCMTEFIERNDQRWRASSPSGGTTIDEMLTRVQARTVSFEDFEDWVRERMATA